MQRVKEFAFETKEYKRLFNESTKFKEGVIFFSDPRTVLNSNTELELESLFNRYIKRKLDLIEL